MKKRKPKVDIKNPININLLNRVIAGFRAQGTNLKEYCNKKEIDVSNTRRAILGLSNGSKAKKVRNEAVNASKANQIHI